jgi:hypothetical protein
MEVRLKSVRKESLSRARESIFTCVIGAHVPTRSEEHRPESDPCTEFHGATTVWERIKPEHGAIDLALPCCAGEWTSIKWRAIQIPGFKRIWLFGRRKQPKSCRDCTRRIATWWRCAPRWAWQCTRKWNARRWCAAAGAAPHPFFEFCFQVRLVRCTFKTCGAEKCPTFKGVFRARRNRAAAP